MDRKHDSKIQSRLSLSFSLSSPLFSLIYTSFLDEGKEMQIARHLSGKLCAICNVCGDFCEDDPMRSAEERLDEGNEGERRGGEEGVRLRLLLITPVMVINE